jgi:hypothetical protein
LFAEGYLLNDNLPRFAARSFLFAGSTNVGLSGGGIFGQPTGSGPSLAGERNEEEAFPGDSMLVERRLAALAIVVGSSQLIAKAGHFPVSFCFCPRSN